MRNLHLFKHHHLIFRKPPQVVYEVENHKTKISLVLLDSTSCNNRKTLLKSMSKRNTRRIKSLILFCLNLVQSEVLKL